MHTTIKSAVYLLLATSLFLISGCTKVERETEFRDGNTLLKDQNHLFLFSREVAENLSVSSYRQRIQALSSDSKLDAETPDDIALLKSVADPIIEQAKKMYPHSRGWEWEYHIERSSDMNAMCFAGGKILVLSGLLENTGRNRDKLALVLGHEVSHALLEHGRAGLSRDWALFSGMWIMAKSFKMGLVRFAVAMEDVQTTLLPMNRNQERDADTLGLELMARAGFNPHEGARAWEDFMVKRGSQTDAGKRLEAFLSSHPTHEDRLGRLTRLADKIRPVQNQEAKP